MNVTCEKCSQKYDVEESMSGQKVECQQCGNVFAIGLKPQLKPFVDSILWKDKPNIMSDWLVIAVGIFLILLGIVITVIAFNIRHPKDREELMPMLLIFSATSILFGLILWGYSWISRRYTEYSISKAKVSIKTGWLNVSENYIHVSDIRSVESSQSIVERIAGIGTIILSSAASSTSANVIIRGIKSHKLIIDMIEKVRSGK